MNLGSLRGNAKQHNAASDWRTKEFTAKRVSIDTRLWYCHSEPDHRVFGEHKECLGISHILLHEPHNYCIYILHSVGKAYMWRDMVSILLGNDMIDDL